MLGRSRCKLARGMGVTVVDGAIHVGQAGAGTGVCVSDEAVAVGRVLGCMSSAVTWRRQEWFAMSLL